MGNQSAQNKILQGKEKEEGNYSIYNIFLLALLSKNHFDFLYVVGRGGFGKVC